MNKQPHIDFSQKNIPNITVTKSALATIVENFDGLNVRKRVPVNAEQSKRLFLLSEGFVRTFPFDTVGNETYTYFYQ